MLRAAGPRAAHRHRARRRRVPAGSAHQRHRAPRARSTAATPRCSTARATSRRTCGSCAPTRTPFCSKARRTPGAVLLRHLSMYKIGREVEVADRSSEHALISADRAPLARARRRGGARASSTRTLSSSSEAPARGPLATDAGVDLLAAPATRMRSSPRCWSGGCGAGRPRRRGDPPGRVGPPALRPRARARDDAGRGGHRRAGRGLREGLLHRPGAGRAAALPRPAEPGAPRACASRLRRRRRDREQRRPRARHRSGPPSSPPPSGRSRSPCSAAKASRATPSRSQVAAAAEIVELPFR